jgi:sterol 24-C-methyltransferase
LKSSSNVNSGIDRYLELHQKEDVDTRNAEYKALIDTYYDLSTLFYEWGWGSSFHFAYRHLFESFAESIRRHEYYLASKLGLYGKSYSQKVIDVGCGIGGPMRNICRFTSQDVTGLTLNQYQVDRGNELCDVDEVVKGKCRSVQGDFMEMPFEGNTFDAAYAIEATCHAPDRVGVYSEIYRVLKPGSVFACYEWCMTDDYVPGNPDHEKMKKKIEEGDGLPDICHTSVCLKAMETAGFEILEERDLAADFIGRSGKVWQLPLLPSWNPLSQRFQFNWLGFQMTNFTVRLLEFLYLAPTGTYKTQQMLQTAGYGLGEAAQINIFTPMYLMVGRVPMTKKPVIKSSQ